MDTGSVQSSLTRDHPRRLMALINTIRRNKGCRRSSHSIQYNVLQRFFQCGHLISGICLVALFTTARPCGGPFCSFTTLLNPSGVSHAIGH